MDANSIIWVCAIICVVCAFIMNVPQLIILPSVGRVLNVAVPSLPAEGLTRKEKPMNAKDYGHHFSGYRKPEATEPSQGFMSRLVFWILVFAVCIGWVMTHTGCAHPIGNGLAALMGFGLVPLRLLCLVLSEAGVE